MYNVIWVNTETTSNKNIFSRYLPWAKGHGEGGPGHKCSEAEVPSWERRTGTKGFGVEYTVMTPQPRFQRSSVKACQWSCVCREPWKKRVREAHLCGWLSGPRSPAFICHLFQLGSQAGLLAESVWSHQKHTLWSLTETWFKFQLCHPSAGN